MNESIIIFTLFYIVFCFCFVFKTSEFVSAGLSIDNLLGVFIGSDVDNFVFFHIKRSSYTILVHALLPLGYRLLLSTVTDYPLVEEGYTLLNLFTTASLLLSVTAAVTVFLWSRDNWENHPISRRLTLFCNANTSWRTLASIINVEYLRVHKITIKCNSLEDVLVTDNWLIKIAPYSLYFAHLSVTTLTLDTAETHNLALTGTGVAQYLNIKVSFIRSGENHSFKFRINALDYKDLEEKINVPINVAENIEFYRSKTDQFLEVFKQQVDLNPSYESTEEVETCCACFVSQSDVKLVKNCTDDACGNCYCRRPMWCMSCMGRWFAARQEDEPQDTWLSRKCMCPSCRSVFCILDICPVQHTS